MIFKPINDLSYIDSGARVFCQGWDKSDIYAYLPKHHNNYFARYPNNQALLIIVSVIYYVCDKLFGVMPIEAPVIINTIGLHISFVLTYLISTKIFKDKFTPLYCGILAAGFTVFYTYTPNFYTDSMSMPFLMGAIYLFLSAIEKSFIKAKAVRIIFCGFLIIAGYKMKGSVIILIPAFLLYLIATCNKINRLNYLKVFGIFGVSLICSSFLCGGIIKSFNLTEEGDHKKIEFPPTHWIMMGLHDRGGYYSNDFFATINSGDYEQKVEFNIEKIKERLAVYGISGTATHIAKKVSYTWGDGTYFVGYYFHQQEHPNIFQRFIANDMLFKWYCSAYQCILLFMILYSFVDGAFSKRNGKDLLLKIIIMGVYFFFVLWETRSRYLVNFSPLFIIISAYSINRINLRIKLFMNKRIK